MAGPGVGALASYVDPLAGWNDSWPAASTGANGRFELAGFAESRTAVLDPLLAGTSGAGFGAWGIDERGRVCTTRAIGPDGALGLELVELPPTELSGRAVARGSGAPVEAYRLALTLPAGGRLSELEDPATGRPVREHPGGAFRWPGLACSLPLVVSIRAEGFEPWDSEPVPPKGGTVDLGTIELEPLLALASCALEVRVADARGAPVAGAAVTLEALPASGASARARTDGEGLARISGQAGTSVRVRARGGPAGAATPWVELALPVADRLEEPVRLVLPAGGRITGRVLDARGGPARAGLRVAAQRNWSAQAEVLATETDEEGRFALGAVPPGPYTVGVGPPGSGGRFRTRRLDDPVEDGPTAFALVRAEEASAVTLQLPARHALRGRVLWAGEPVPRPRVRLAFQGGQLDPGTPAEIDGDGEGAFVYQGLRSGTYRVLAFAPGSSLAARATVAIEGADAELELVLPGGVLRGRVVDGEGYPVRGVGLTAVPAASASEDFAGLFGGGRLRDPYGPPTRAAQDWVLPALTDAQGAFRLEGLPEDRPLWVELRAVEHRVRGLELPPLQEHGGDLGVIELPEPAALRLRVDREAARPEGEGEGAFWYELEYLGRSEWRQLALGPGTLGRGDGRELPGLEPGPYRFVLSWRASRLGAAGFSMGELETRAEVELELAPGEERELAVP